MPTEIEDGISIREAKAVYDETLPFNKAVRKLRPDIPEDIAIFLVQDEHINEPGKSSQATCDVLLVNFGKEMSGAEVIEWANRKSISSLVQRALLSLAHQEDLRKANNLPDNLHLVSLYNAGYVHKEIVAIEIKWNEQGTFPDLVPIQSRFDKDTWFAFKE